MAKLGRCTTVLVLVVAACSAAVSCGHDDDRCIPLPCPMPIAVQLRVTASTGGAVSGASVEVTGTLSGTASCTVEATVSRCFVPGYRGTYSLRIAAPGFQAQELTVAVAGSDGEPCGCPQVNIQVLDVVLEPTEGALHPGRGRAERS